jgi:hypothetical protein
LTDHDIRPFMGETGSFVNRGRFRKWASSGTSTISIPFRDVGGTIQVEGQGRLAFGHPENRFERTTFMGPGTVAFTQGATLTGITNQGAKLELAGGDFRGSVHGETLWTGGTLFLSNQGNAPFDNHGILSISDETPRFMSSGSFFQNFGTLELAAGNTRIEETTSGRTETMLHNWGLIRKDVLPGINSLGKIHIINRGALELNGSNGVTKVHSPWTDFGGTLHVPGGVLEFHSPQTRLERSILTGSGTVRLANGATLTAVTNLGGKLELAGGDFRGAVYGETLWTGGTLFLGNIGNAPFDNHGTLSVSDESPRFVNSGAFLQNFGTLELAAGSTRIEETASGRTETTLHNWGVIRKGVLPGSNSLGRIHIINRGTLQLTGSNGLTAIHSSWTDIGGTLHVPGGVLEFRGPQTRLEGTTFTGPGRVRLANGGNLATVTNLDSSLELAGGYFTGTNSGTIFWTGGILAQFVNRGTLLVHSNTQETLSVAGNLFNEGRIEGVGPVQISHPNSIFYSGGVLSPGWGIGSLEIHGAVALLREGSVILEVASPEPGGHDSLKVASRLHLAGRLVIALTNGFVPAPGDRFQLFQASQRTGAFDTFELPALPSGLFWRTENLEFDGSLSVGLTPATLGPWRETFFTEAQLSDPAYSGWDADPDGDGLANWVEAVFGFSPVAAEATLARQNLPKATLASQNGQPKLEVEFSLPEKLPQGTVLRIDACDELTAAKWTSIATKAGDGPWTGPAVVNVFPGERGRVRIRLIDQEIGAHGSRYIRVVGINTLP